MFLRHYPELYEYVRLKWVVHTEITRYTVPAFFPLFPR